MNDTIHSICRFTLIGAALTAALAASAGAQATEIIGAIPNEAGGEILMTNDKCGAKGKNGRGTIATGKGGEVTHSGCAYSLPPARVIIEWGSGGATVVSMSDWAPNATDRSLKSFSDAELDMLAVRTAWFEGKTQIKAPAPRAPLAKPAAVPMLVEHSRRTP